LTDLLPTDWAIGLYLGHLVLLIVTFGVTFLLFALIFRFLPDVHIRWADVLVGAVITSALFMIGKYLIGLYLGTSAVGSSYGAAGSFVVLLMWLYYSTLILLFGAELTHVYADRYGYGAPPTANAVPLARTAAGPQPASAEASHTADAPQPTA